MIEQTHESVESSTDIILQIADDCCRKWFDNPSEGLIDIFIYPVVGITVDQLQDLIKIEWPIPQKGWKGTLAAADIHSMKLLDFTSQVRVNDEGPRLSYPSESIRESEFKGPAIIIAIPVNYAEVGPVSTIVSLLRLYRGSAIAWGYPLRLRYNGKTKDKWITMSSSKPYSQNTEGPFDSPSMSQHIAESLTGLFCTNNSNRDRAFFALELFTQANESTSDPLRVRIFQYWSAIETLCDSNKESVLLSYVFMNGSGDTTESRRLFNKARVLRHNVTHKGYHPLSCPHILERYLQVIFIDMLRVVLELPYEGYLEQFIARHGTFWLQENYNKRSFSKSDSNAASTPGKSSECTS